MNVVATTPAPIATPIVGANFTNEEINSLATSRTLAGIAELSPGLTNVTPNTGQVSINGAFAFDNVFMINGVDVNDNLFGSPQNLFIEDAIQETQVLTSGISAEYGRFSGGVINAITKSGGNTFTGTGRVNFTNPSWSTETPFEVSSDSTHKDILNKSWEGTFGGPLVKDRLWFFTAGRYFNQNVAGALDITGFSYTQVNNDKRGEVKLTGSINPNHTITGGFVNSPLGQTERPTFGFTIDKFAIGDRTLPNNYYYTNYHGVLGPNLLAEAAFSQRHFKFENSGGSLTDIVDSPMITLTQQLGHFNAQYFDATDPEERNNKQFTGSITWFGEGYGRHEVKTGYEFYRSQDTGGNSQSATNYVFDADYATDANGDPIYDAEGHLLPVFDPGNTLIEHWLPIRGAILNVDNNSVYAQDHWTLTDKVSADVGARFEHVRTKATGGLIGIDTDTIVPRLALAYDINGDGKYVAHVTYGHYSGRYNEAQIGANNERRQPEPAPRRVHGPGGSGARFRPGLRSGKLCDRVRAVPHRQRQPQGRPVVAHHEGVHDVARRPGVDARLSRGHVRVPAHEQHHRRLHQHRERHDRRGAGWLRRGHVHQHRLRQQRLRLPAVPGAALPGPLRHPVELVGQRALHADAAGRWQLRRRGDEPTGRHVEDRRLPGDLQRLADVPDRTAPGLPASQAASLDRL